MKGITIFIFFYGLRFFSIGQPLLILQGDEKNNIGKFTATLKDSTNLLTIYDVIKLDYKFIPCHNEVFNHEISPTFYWVKLKTKNITNNQYLLEINNPTLYYFEIYVFKKNKLEKVFKDGWKLPYSKKLIKVNNYLYPIDLPKDDTISLYIKYQSIPQTDIPLSFRTTKKQIEENSNSNFVYGILYGVFLFSLFYSFFIFYTSRDIIYFYYGIYITGFFVWRIISHGHATQYFLPDGLQANWITANVSFIIASIFMIAFALSFLKTKSTAPGFLPVAYLFILAFIVCHVIGYFNKYKSIYLVNLTYLLIFPFLMVMALYVYLKGYKTARYYLLASTVFLFSTLLTVFKQLTIVPYTFFTNNAVNFGIAIEAMLLSFALGDRYFESEKQKREFQEKLKDELEIKVQDRIKAQEELDNINKKLRAININIDTFLYTATNDIKLYISDINILINQMEKRNSNEEEIAKNSVKLRELVEKFKISINDLAERKNSKY